MTSVKAPAAKPKPRGWLRFPDPPETQDERMTAFDHLTINGNAYLLAQHLGNRSTECSKNRRCVPEIRRKWGFWSKACLRFTVSTRVSTRP